MKLFSNFMSIPFDYLLISWVTNYVRNRGFLTCLSGFYRVYREVQNFSEFFNKIPVRILLDVIFCVFRFSKASLNVLTSSFIKFQTSRRMDIVLGTFTYSRARSIGL